MIKDTKFFYTYKWIKQAALLENMPDINIKEEIGIGHISVGGSLLCGQNPDAIEKDSVADGHFTVANWHKGVALCPECQQRWKTYPGSPWKLWEDREAKRV